MTRILCLPQLSCATAQGKHLSIVHDSLVRLFISGRGLYTL